MSRRTKPAGSSRIPGPGENSRPKAGRLSLPSVSIASAAAASTASSPSPIARPFFGMAFSPVCWNTVSIPQPPADFRPFLSDY